MQMINEEIATYAENHSSRESKVVNDLARKSDRELAHSDMLSGKVVGQLLAMLVRISKAKTILELGTFTGYSALRMAEALPDDGLLLSCDVNERYAKIARHAFGESEHGHKIQLKMGPALKTIEKLDQLFDFIFLDADKNNYPDYYEAVLPKLSSGGLLVIDNVLWDGKVLHPKDEKTRSIHRLNKIIADDDTVDQVMLTVRDGLTVVRKR